MKMIFFGVILLLVSLAFLVLGLINPTLVIKWGKEDKKNRKRVALYFVIGFVVSIFLISVSPSDATNVISGNTIESASTLSEDGSAQSVDVVELEELEAELVKVKLNYDVLKSENQSLKDENQSLEGKNITLNEKIAEAAPWFEFNEEEKKAIEKELTKIKEEEAEAEKQKAEEERLAKEEEEKKGYDTGITYDQLARTPDDYEGEKVKFYGKVIQVIEGDGTTELRIAVNSDYDKIIYVSYTSSIVSSRILEDDKITVMGSSYGLLSYESTLGGTITIPAIIVDKIDQ